MIKDLANSLNPDALIRTHDKLHLKKEEVEVMKLSVGIEILSSPEALELLLEILDKALEPRYKKWKEISDKALSLMPPPPLEVMIVCKAPTSTGSQNHRTQTKIENLTQLSTDVLKYIAFNKVYSIKGIEI